MMVKNNQSIFKLLIKSKEEALIFFIILCELHILEHDVFFITYLIAKTTILHEDIKKK